MPETCENWLDLVHSCIYYTHQTREIYYVLPYSVDFKAPRELWNPPSKMICRECSFIPDKGPVNKLVNNFDIGPVNIFPNF